jgi:hypothetical protein
VNDSARGPGPLMMGNIGLTKQGVVIDKKDTNRLLNDLVKDLEIENVLGVDKDNKKPTLVKPSNADDA